MPKPPSAILLHVYTCELYKEEAGLVSGGKGWFLLVSGEEGLVSAGFRVGRTGFGWFQGGKDWFRLVSCGKDWFRLIPLFSNYHAITLLERAMQ